MECYTQACKRDGTKMLKFHSFHVQKSSSDFIFPTLSNSLVFSAFTGHNFHAQMPLYSLTLFSLHSHTLSLSLSTRPNSQSATLQIKLRFDLSNTSGHESQFRVSRLYSATPILIKIKIRFSILLFTQLRLKVETLSTLISLL